MIDQALVAHIKHIEIRTKRILRGLEAGNKRSLQKGYGIDFDQIRDYQLGDDVRFIDWKSSARTNKLLVKQFLHEHTRTILLVIDASASMYYSSTDMLKYHCAVQAAVIMGLIGQNSQDQVGLVIFSDEIELYVPPRRGPAHLKEIIKKLMEFKVSNKTTKLESIMKFIGSLKRKDTIICFFSDFIAESYEKLLKIISKKTDLLAIRCLDPLELALPAVGLLSFSDIESFSKYDVKLANSAWLTNRMQSQNNLFMQYGIDVCDIFTDRPFFDHLIQFLLGRTKKIV